MGKGADSLRGLDALIDLLDFLFEDVVLSISNPCLSLTLSIPCILVYKAMAMSKAMSKLRYLRGCLVCAVCGEELYNR